MKVKYTFNGSAAVIKKLLSYVSMVGIAYALLMLSACGGETTVTNTITQTEAQTITQPAQTVTETITTTTTNTTTSTITITSQPTSITTTATETTTSSVVTFGQLAVQGEAYYNSNCTSCHYYTGSSAVSVISHYGDAQDLLNKIATMPGGYGQPGDQILAYLLVEYDFVPEDTIFNPDTLDQISLSAP
jgi:cytochrome c5